LDSIQAFIIDQVMAASPCRHVRETGHVRYEMRVVPHTEEPDAQVNYGFIRR